MMVMMVFDVLRPLLCIRLSKWDERPRKAIRRSERWNTILT